MEHDFSNVQGDFEGYKPRIVVIGCGGGGSNTVTTLTERGVEGATTVALNTDAKHLATARANKKVLIGKNLTRGLGAGGFPEVGKQAALENRNDIKDLLAGVDLVFVTCGLGGGTGTGAAPVIARFAKEAGAIVIAAVTMPFKLEGARLAKAEEGLKALREYADTVIAIENQKLLELAGKQPLKQAFSIADTLIATMIKGITETIAVPSLVNLDYADIKAVMKAGGVATIGIGVSEESKHRAKDAVARAMNHPLLDVDYSGAKGALIQVVGGDDLKMEEIHEIGEYVQQQLDPSAQVMWGARILPEYNGRVQVITIVTGVKSPFVLGQQRQPKPAKEANELGIEVLR